MKQKSIAALLTVLMLTLLLAGCSQKPASVYTGPAPGLPSDERVYRGETYHLRDDLTTILVMGLDKYERPENNIGFTNQLQSDFMMVLVIDEDAQTCEVLHLNRDTMTKIRSLGIGGGTAGSFVGQLALAHTYGSGGSDSCLNAVRAVSDLLWGVDIDHYMTLTMDAVSTINDRAGGVTLTLLDDLTEFDEAMVKGQEVTLMGEQALLYVRSRMGLDDSSNLRRMERQRQYLKELYGKVKEKSQQDEDFLTKLLLDLSESFVSDLSVYQLKDLMDLMETCEVAPIRTLAGTAVKGEEYMEYYVEEDALLKTVVELFCKPE